MNELNNNNTIIFTISRMNPPTPGHLLLIKELINEAIRQNAPTVYVILSKNNENNENPIDCQEKITILGNTYDPIHNMVQVLKNNMKLLARQELEQSALESYNYKIDNINVVFICVRPEDKTPFSTLSYIINLYPQIPNSLNLFMIIGEDRAVDFFDNITNTFLFGRESINSVNGRILPRENMTTLKNLSDVEISKTNIEEVPDQAFSGSFVRKLVKLGMKDKFDDVYRRYLTQDKINILYDRISEGLNKPALVPPPLQKDKGPKELKYKYPIVKGDDQFNFIIEQKARKDAEKAAEKMRKDAEKALKEENSTKRIKTQKGGKKYKKKTIKKQRRKPYKGNKRYKSRKQYR